MTSPITVEVLQLPHGQDLPLPAYQTAHAAGMDHAAAVPDDAPVTLAPGQRALIPTGLAIALPPGFEAQVRPRSGLAVKHGITVLNSPGTIDADYRGEIGVPLINHGDAPFVISPWRTHCANDRRTGGAGHTDQGRRTLHHRARQRRVRLHRPVAANDATRSRGCAG